jgi:hypothetical protein
MWRGNTAQGLVTETPIESQRHARTVLAHATAAAGGNSTITALTPYRQGLLPSVRVFIGHLEAEFPKAVVM